MRSRANLSRALWLGSMAAIYCATSTHAIDVRKDIANLSEHELSQFRSAVQIVRSRGAEDVTSWAMFAGIHGISPGDDVFHLIPERNRQLLNQCHRNGSLFFAWHRAYVAFLERVLQQAVNDPSLRIPYWNWYVDRSLPAAFRTKTYIEGSVVHDNPLYIEGRYPGVNEGEPIWSGEIETDFIDTDFRTFQDDLASAEHGEIHIAVGNQSNMARVETAARDPVFFLHHANVDRLLVVWARAHPGSSIGTDVGWSAGRYLFPVAGGGTGSASFEELDLSAQQAFGYRYENVDLPVAPARALPSAPHLETMQQQKAGPAAPDRRSVAAARPIGGTVGVGAGSSFRLAIPVQEGSNLLHALEGGKSKDPSRTDALITFVNLRVTSVPPGVLSYKVFLNLEGAEAGARYLEHYVGSISLFDLQHGSDGRDLVLAIRPRAGGKALRDTLRQGSQDKHLTISMIPTMAPGNPQPPLEAVLLLDEIRISQNAAAPAQEK